MLRLRRGVPIFVCSCGALKIGTNTLQMDGASHLIKWRTTSGIPAQAGDVGMDLATGRLQMFVGGTSVPVAHVGDIGANLLSYVGSVGIDTDLAISPALASGEALKLEITAQWAPGAAGQKIRLRARPAGGAYDTTGYYSAIWASDTALVGDGNVNGIPVIWSSSITADRKFYASGTLLAFGASGVRYLGMSTILVPAGGVEVIRTHSGWRESLASATIDAIRFERTTAGTLSSFLARVWRFKTS